MRQTPLVRRKGLNTGVSTLARTGIKRTPKDGTPGKPLERAPGKRSATRTSKTAKGMGETKARPPVYARSGGWCEIRLLDVCLGPATEWHHRQNRSQQGLWCPSNGLHVCSLCHLAMTNTNGHRSEYEANGWKVRSRRNPAEVPVLLARPDGSVVLALLDDLGAWTPAQPHPKQQGGKAA